MSKVTLKVEIDEETYKQIKGDSIYDNNNKIIISKSSSAYHALNAIINATPLTESDDAVSRQAVIDAIEKEEYKWDALDAMKALPPVLPKREQGEWIEEFNDIEGEVRFTCSLCGEYQLFETDFCPNCGAEMRWNK